MDKSLLLDSSSSKFNHFLHRLIRKKVNFDLYFRYGGERQANGMDMKAISDEVIKENKENIKKKVMEEGYNAAAG